MSDEVKTLGGRNFEELRREAYKKWWQYGWRSPDILWKRSRLHHWHPFKELKYARQRMRRGYSDCDVWSFSDHLARVIRGGTRDLRRISHGHPNEITWGEWMKVLTEIEEGMWAAARISEPGGSYTDTDREQDQKEFDLAMGHLHKWFFDLWD